MTQIHSLVPLWKIAVEVNRQIYQVLGGRTHNILGEFAEQLVADSFKGQLASPSTKGYDVILSNGQKIQVKARKIDGTNGQTLSDIHSWNFDLLVVVLFKDDGRLHKVLQIDANTANTFAGKRKNGGYVISLTKKFINATTDITNSFASYGL